MDHLANSIFLISFGIEDFVGNYRPPSNGTLSHLTADIFTELLIDALASYSRGQPTNSATVFPKAGERPTALPTLAVVSPKMYTAGTILAISCPVPDAAMIARKKIGIRIGLAMAEEKMEAE
ncbi:hypothetical protein RHSIM_Rhsim09G0120500 [Rhododendron simsii]|uniref:Uncharacterized protein n=1 Tax=Rhododendron simsii TaxID=118357 RepID=A0A834GF94_RHOSS|nr:hypothetical protein RHSIM_Rhsim09G0120500 [Rhododendron simsii]